jgi:hypothetical protein
MSGAVVAKNASASLAEVPNDLLRIILEHLGFFEIISLDAAIKGVDEFYSRFLLCLREIDTKGWSLNLGELFWLFEKEVVPTHLHLTWLGRELTCDKSIGKWLDTQPSELVERFRNGLTSLTIDSENDPMLVMLGGFGPFPRLTELSLLKCRIPSRTLQLFLKQHKDHLRSLKISSTSLLTGDIIWAIQDCHQLEQLALPGCRWFDFSSLRALRGHLPKLRAIDLSGTRVRYDDRFIAFLKARGEQLESFQLSELPSAASDLSTEGG